MVVSGCIFSIDDVYSETAKRVEKLCDGFFRLVTFSSGIADAKRLKNAGIIFSNDFMIPGQRDDYSLSGRFFDVSYRVMEIIVLFRAFFRAMAGGFAEETGSEKMIAVSVFPMEKARYQHCGISALKP